MSQDAMQSSQGQGSRAAIERANMVQGILSDLAAETQRLKNQCASLRVSRSAIESSLAALRTDLAALEQQRADARLDLVADKETIQRWLSREGGVPNDARSKADAAGRAVRRAHVYELQVQETEKRLLAAKEEGAEAVEAERLVAQGLRDRIGRLEGRLKGAEKARDEAREEVLGMNRKAADKEKEARDKEEKWTRERGDFLDAKDALKVQLEKMKGELDKAQEERRDAVEQLRRHAGAVPDPTKAMQIPARPATPLRQQLLNLPQTPSKTPTASSNSSNNPLLGPTQHARSPPRASASGLGGQALPTTPISLARRCTYLEERHSKLNASYETLRARHQQDLQSWREWKEAFGEREKEKAAKRAKRRAARCARGEAAGMSSEAGPSSVGGGTGRVGREEVIVEASDESVPQLASRGIGGAPHSEHGLDGFGTVKDAEEAFVRAPISPRAATSGAATPNVAVAGKEEGDKTPVPPEDEFEEPEYCSPADVAFARASVQPADHTTGKHATGQPLNDPTTDDAHFRDMTPAAPAPHIGSVLRAEPAKTSIRRSLHTHPAKLLDTHGGAGHSAGTPARISPPGGQARTPQANPLARSASRTLVRTGSASTPRTATVPQASRTTPWLGRAAPLGRTGSRSNIAQSARADEEDPFASPPDVGYGDAAVTPASKLLVRDRGQADVGAGQTQTPRQVRGQVDASLLRSTLRRGQDGQGIGLAAEGSAAADPNTPRSRVDAEYDADAADRGSVSKSKRKRSEFEVDLAALSAAEKSAHLKRLAKMSAAERRDVYAAYKGNGRYIAPDEIQRGVADEYEIDPRLNEGQAHQFHDVKRKREDRANMHASDCECCRGYYEAIGHVPLYNQGPKWNDAVRDDAGEGDEEENERARVQEHQNRISRHRDTWAKPPTPPGYWAIGFPNTQDVTEQNAAADVMLREKEERIRREAEQGMGKWRRKGNGATTT